MFIIDFDDTLFDTYNFKLARLKAMRRLGVPPEIFWRTYQKASNNNENLFTYSDARHAGILGLSGFDEKKILSALQKVSKKIKEFLIKDAEVFLNSLRELGQPMILLSLGEPGFQELKVKASGIDKYFDRLFMVERSKESVLRELFANNKEISPWLINDKVDEAQQLLLQFPKLQVVLKMSASFPGEAYLKSGLPHFFTLLEILDYIKKEITIN